MTLTSSRPGTERLRYSSAAAAALAYHFGMVVLVALQVVRYPPRNLLDVLDSSLIAQALAIVPVVFALRGAIAAAAARSRREGRGEARLAWDLGAFALVLIVLAVSSLPFDSSGAGLLGLVTIALLGVPFVLLMAPLSAWAMRSTRVRTALTTVLVLDILAYVTATGHTLALPV